VEVNEIGAMHATDLVSPICKIVEIFPMIAMLKGAATPTSLLYPMIERKSVNRWGYFLFFGGGGGGVLGVPDYLDHFA